MKYVIIRDDDTNTLTPIECLETLYRPFLDRGLPVCLATIPNVRSDVCLPSGPREGFLVASKGAVPRAYPIGENAKLVGYLRANSHYEIVQHGYHHEFVGTQTEFDHNNRADIARRLDLGTRYLLEAGFEKPKTFVAPYDRVTPVGYRELARRFKIISTGWFERARLPRSWWPGLIIRKLRKCPHWRHDGVTLLSHPGCLLSYHRPCKTMLDQIRRSIESRQLTVLVTHWWEFFRDGESDLPFIQVLHETAAYLAAQKEIKVIRFSDILNQNIPLN
jgi:hypothetical protein